ncbi:glycolipid 2-alpha-mannosyltransferase [Ophiocordyceps camponoti-floridani]|uniref:Glycolipid 2-alpha-mannosyltransferase n=1 Tax=Ophiocordyceps camponoti-floridani TaxID=2030778 RepID=A0A8H4VFC7_9HYPO|nr:glycolipid 2-alpha-mannosyltransferase [Ophiocordyceps camponoti-floridani]
MADTELPIALRKPRRSIVRGPSETAAAEREPQTPRKTKRAVRFSDPGPLTGTSGLTPMVRRASIGTPQRRRVSTPGRTPQRRHGISTPSKTTKKTARGDDAVLGPTVASQCLHQANEGRIARRIRRNNFRELLNRLEQQKKSREREMVQLKAEIKARDRDIYELRNATIVVDTERIWDLERQVEGLKQELDRRSADASARDCSRIYNWALSTRERQDDETTNAFTEEYGDEEGDYHAVDDDHFGDVAALNLAASTPSRAVRSRNPLTPPTTSPAGPGSPCWREVPLQTDAAVQASMADVARQQAEQELASLRLEVGRLTTRLDSYRDLGERIGRRIRASVGEDGEPTRGTTSSLETQTEKLLQMLSDRTAALEKLTLGVAELGFPGEDAGAMVAALASGFRSARLELEYLTPGESRLPLTRHGAEVLDLVLCKLRQLAKGAAEDEATIDEYHATEQSLRKQLDARVAAMDGLCADAARAERLLDEQRIANNRLRHAVDGYVRDMTELEALVERMERQGEAEVASREAAMVTVEARLAAALARSEKLQREVEAAGDAGAALALRDARVLELRAEVERGREAVEEMRAGMEAERERARGR